MSIQLVTGPATTAVTIQQVKDQARVSNTADDQIITEMTQAAVTYLENVMKRSFVETEWDLFLDRFPGAGRLFAVSHINVVQAQDLTVIDTERNERAIRPTRSNLLSVTHLKYTDVDGVLQTLVEGTDFVIDTATEPGRVVEAVGKTWPTTQDIPNAVNLRFKAGYGATDANVPKDIQQMIKMLAAHYYENREAWVSEGSMIETPMAVENILQSQMIDTFP